MTEPNFLTLVQEIRLCQAHFLQQEIILFCPVQVFNIAFLKCATEYLQWWTEILNGALKCPYLKMSTHKESLLPNDSLYRENVCRIGLRQLYVIYCDGLTHKNKKYFAFLTQHLLIKNPMVLQFSPYLW